MGILSVLPDALASSARRMQKDAAFSRSLLLRRPFQVLVQLTNRCNMRCTFCDFPNNAVKPSEELTTADHARVSDELATIGPFIVSLEGGEPFLRDDLVDIAAAYGKHHLPVLYTNGWYLHERGGEQRARALWAAGVEQIGVSIDFPDEARQDAKRGLAGGFARARATIELLRDTAPRGGDQVHVMTVLLDENKHELDALLRLSASLGVAHNVTLVSTHGTRRAGDSDAPPPPFPADELRGLWQRHPHWKTFRSYIDGVDLFLRDPQQLPACHAGKQSFNLDHVGNVAPCIEKIGAPVGNVRTESVLVLLDKLRAVDNSTCQDCFTLCRGLAQALGGGSSTRDLYDLATRMRV